MCTCLWSPETIDSAVPCRCSYISRHMLTQYCNICIDGFAALSQNFTIQLFTSYFTRFPLFLVLCLLSFCSIDHAKSLCTVVGRVPQGANFLRPIISQRLWHYTSKLQKIWHQGAGSSTMASRLHKQKETSGAAASQTREKSPAVAAPVLTLDLFEWIELEPFQFWRSLLFMDQYNYGGIPAKSDESQVDIISSWNIAEYLPKKIQTSCDQFIVIVSQFLYIPWSYAQKQAGIRESMLNGDSCTPSINIGAAKALESEMIEYIKEQISSFFTDNLLRILRYIVLHMKRASKSEDDPSTSSGLPQIVGDQHRGDAS
ncbi:hypothetical protein Ahy_A06g028876 isoform A [Arachis hypogaea]|uniref:DNA polymerase epsilon catalytic subunit n=1 Tax=Arachis hypogaea TaxID=3818 RepID=A0A445CS20_ARAHY|nr:hypothetical protein Ahy_A06g028876 isoform A [Arachis hypogaea]